MMNPGPLVEKSMDVADSAVQALKQSPLMLALVLLQLLTIGAILWSSMHRQEAVSEQIAALHSIIEKCLTRGL
jgi:hypothetical protein